MFFRKKASKLGLFNRLRQWTAPQQVTLSFVVVILVGSLLLSIPTFHQPTAQVSYLDHLFTSVSMGMCYWIDSSVCSRYV